MSVTKNILVMPVTWSGTTPNVPTGGWAAIFTQVNAFYAEDSYGQFAYNFTFAPTITIATPSDPTNINDPDRAAVIAAATTAGDAPNSYDGWVYLWPTVTTRAEGNIADSSGFGLPPFINIATLAGGLNDFADLWPIVAHECGHMAGSLVTLIDYSSGLPNMALPHSHSIVSSSQFNPADWINPTFGNPQNYLEYGNTYCVQGSAVGNGVAGHHSARHKDALGWMTSRKQTVTASGSYTLSNLEATSPANPQALIISSGGFTYWLEYRQPTGFDSFISGGGYTTPTGPLIYALPNGTPLDQAAFLNQAFILDMTPLTAQDNYDKDASLQQGQTFTAPDGTTIKTTAHNATSTIVQVVLANSMPNTYPLTLDASGNFSQAVTVATGANPVTVTATDNSPALNVATASFNITVSQPVTGGFPSQIGIIVFENNGAGSINQTNTPNLVKLIAKYMNFTSYTGTSNPSLPDYCAMVSGSWLGKAGTDSGTNGFAGTHSNIFHAAELAGKTWKAYEEDVTKAYSGGGSGSSGNGLTGWFQDGLHYATRHCPANFFTNTNGSANRHDFRDQPNSKAGTGTLIADIAAASLPDFFYITPNILNDGHESKAATTNTTFVEAWLNGTGGGTPAFPGINALIGGMRSDGVCLLTFDNVGGGGGGPNLLALVVGPNVAAGTNSTAQSHLSMLWGIQNGWGIAKFTDSDVITAYKNLTATQAFPWPTH